MQTNVKKVKRNSNIRCYMCSTQSNLYRLTVVDHDAKSAYFLPLCTQCAKELADELLSIIKTSD